MIKSMLCINGGFYLSSFFVGGSKIFNVLIGCAEESMKDSLVGIVAVANRSSLPRKNPNSSSSVRNKNLHDGQWVYLKIWISDYVFEICIVLLFIKVHYESVILKKSNLSEEIKTSCSTDVKKDLTSAEIIRKMPPSNAKQGIYFQVIFVVLLYIATRVIPL